ncbi:hypothetical protein B0T22DRAFT_473328 [Podospora appendiculata]|uniref:Secreted protein n=1 Tax=Podospora appendiculata TaxID=314037 RepID=A0AAE1C7C4_9PEZI|nr:hypothetical protein B0T22DRAFT_473328 [Podospora appendiculata]
MRLRLFLLLLLLLVCAALLFSFVSSSFFHAQNGLGWVRYFGFVSSRCTLCTRHMAPCHCLTVVTFVFLECLAGRNGCLLLNQLHYRQPSICPPTYLSQRQLAFLCSWDCVACHGLGARGRFSSLCQGQEETLHRRML